MSAINEEVRHAAGKINPLIGDSATDTMSKVASVLHYLSDIKTLDGISLDEDSEYGHELILKICRKALLFDVVGENLQTD